MLFQNEQKSVWLNFAHLYYFKIIASEESVIKAAKKLRLGQSTLSTQLKQLEENLGTKLFDRKNKRLIITDHGKSVLDYANEIFKMGGEMIEMIHDRKTPGRVHVQIGALDSIPKHVTLQLAEAAYQIGNCSISILEGKADELLRELEQHRIDLLVSNFVPNVSQQLGLYSRLFASTPVVICGAKRFANLKKNFPRSLDGQPFVLPTLAHSKLRQDIDHYFKLRGIQIDIVAETQDTSLQKLFGIKGIGLIPLSYPAAAPYLKSGELAKIGEVGSVEENLYLLAASRKIENPISSKLIKTFKIETH